MIHVYGFSKAQDPEFDFHEVCSKISYNMHVLFAWLIEQTPGCLFEIIFPHPSP
jgi:hypothetical protein